MSTSASKLQDAESNAAATKTLEDQPQSGSPNQTEENSSEELAQSGKIPESGDGEDLEGEEEGECGFCLFMKGGGCKDSFIEWEKCIEEAEKNKEDIVEKCFEVTGALKKCMEAHADYYEPILKAEKMAEEEAIIELEKEITPNATQQNTDSKDLEVNADSENLEEQKASVGEKIPTLVHSLTNLQQEDPFERDGSVKFILLFQIFVCEILRYRKLTLTRWLTVSLFSKVQYTPINTCSIDS